jgi:hypothetical protein
MSLKSFVERPEVRALLSSYITVVPTPGFIPPPLLVPPRSAEYMLMGAAFDYLLRSLAERLNPSCHRGPWIATGALAFFREELTGGDPSLFAAAKECHDRALAAHKKYLSDGVLSDELLLGVIHLARIDRIYRDGPEYFRKEWLSLPYTTESAELRHLYEVVPLEKFESKDQCFLNPVFDLASHLVRGADADLIVDDCLIDVKTTRYLKFKTRDLHQIVGYYLLYLLTGVSAKRPIGKINRVGVYFSRHAFLHTLELEKIIEPGQIQAVLKRFVELAAPDVQERAKYYGGFTHPACRNWLDDLTAELIEQKALNRKDRLLTRIKSYAAAAVAELKEEGSWERFEERINYRCDCDVSEGDKGKVVPSTVTFVLHGESLEIFTVKFDVKRGRGRDSARENVDKIKREVLTYFNRNTEY